MLSFNDKISIRQFQVLLILDVFGTGVILAPRRSAAFAQQDGWIVVLISTLIALVMVWIMTTLGRMFPDQSFTVYASRIVSKPVAVLLSLGFSAKLIMSAALELRLFGEIVKQSMLYNTPFWVICIAMLLLGAYAAAKGYETQGRIGELLIVIIFIPLILVFIITSRHVDFGNIRPVLITPASKLFEGGLANVISFSGIEICLLAVPYISNVKNMRRGALISVLLIGAAITIITVLAIAQFGYADVLRQMWPTLELMDTIVLPTSFIERQEALTMSFWIISIFAIVSAGLFFSSVLLKESLKVGRHSIHIGISAVLIFALSFYPTNIMETIDYLTLLFKTFGWAYMLFIPLGLLLIAKLRRLGGKHDKSNAAQAK